MDYLFILHYNTDAERKRIDYAIERWGNTSTIRKLRGSTFIFSGDNVEPFIEDLYSRIHLPERSLEIYRVDKYYTEIDISVRTLIYDEKEDSETIQKFLKYLMSKINANYEYSNEGMMVYTVPSKKGRAKILIEQLNHKGGLTKISIEGYGDVVDYLADKINYEMNIFYGVGLLE